MERRICKARSARVVAFVAAAILTACLSPREAYEEETSDRFETIRAYMHTWLSEASNATLIISSSRLKEEILDDWLDQSDKYRIVSVRNPDDYKTAGHIPYAINIYWVDIMKDESLERLDSDKTLILYCYYGHGSMISLTMLSLLGYESHSLDFGMMDWNLDALVKEPWDREADYEVEKAVNMQRESYPLPTIESHLPDAGSIIKERARAYLAGAGSPIIRSSSIKGIVDDWDHKKAEYQIVDVRSKVDYEAGHVPRAINIPWTEIADTKNLRKLDPHRTVITFSDNGQTGQLAATVLNLLGYNAVNMLFGMMDWNKAYVDSPRQWDGAAGYRIAVWGTNESVHEKESAAGLIGISLDESGIEGAKTLFERLLVRRDEYEFVEDEFVALGYRKLRGGRVTEAAEVFRMATRTFPESWKAWDSLGETMLYAGDRDEALRCYGKSVELNADNWRSKWVVDRIDWFLYSYGNETRAINRYETGEPTGRHGPYFGETPPGREPKLFAPGIVSCFASLEYTFTSLPTGGEVYFSRNGVRVSRLEEDGWTAPALSPLSEEHPRAFEPHVTPDGRKMYFGNGPEIWVMDRGQNGWGQARAWGPGMYATTDREGNLYVTDISREEDGNIVVARPGKDGYGDPATLGDEVNSLYSDAHPCIAPDGSFLIFDSRRPGAVGGEGDGDFWICFRTENGSWTEAINVGEPINTPGDELCATVSQDGKYLFYTSRRDIYWVSIDILEDLRPE